MFQPSAKLIFAKNIETWVAISLDTSQIFLTTFMIVYIATKGIYKQLSWKIRFQILLLWTLPFLFDICNFWMFSKDQYLEGNG